MSMKADPCQKYACDIQYCLQANNYQESKCENALEAMRKCCEKFAHKSTCCSGIKQTVFTTNAKSSTSTSKAQTFPKPWMDDDKSPSVSDLKIILSDASGIQFLPSNAMDEVYPGIYIGEESAALNILQLQKLGISHVLNTAMGKTLAHCNTGPSRYKKANMKYMEIRADDIPTFNMQPFFKSAADFIATALSHSGKILVHCKVGASRSATIVIAYLMLKKGMKVNEATELIRAKREICPNDGFLAQLCRLQEYIESKENSKDSANSSQRHICIVS